MIWVYVRTAKNYWRGPFEITKHAWTKRRKVLIDGKLTAKKDLFLFSEDPNFSKRRPRNLSTARLYEAQAKLEYSVEAITEFRTKDGKAEVKVKWTGYPGQDSWEPLENMIHLDILIKQ
jgi:hypothetical protein